MDLAVHCRPAGRDVLSNPSQGFDGGCQECDEVQVAAADPPAHPKLCGRSPLVMQRLHNLSNLARLGGRAIMPIGAVRAFEARRVFRTRGLGRVPLRAAAEAWLAGVHLLPADLDLRDALVIDIGANEGKFSGAVLGIAPGARIVAVEPGEAPRKRLQARLGANPNVEILDVAVSSRTGTATFHLTAHDHNSSLRSPLPKSQEVIGGGWEVVDTVQVDTVSLDELVGDRDVDVLKIDVQGGEMDVIEGGVRTLERTRAVLLEMNFLPAVSGGRDVQRAARGDGEARIRASERFGAAGDAGWHANLRGRLLRASEPRAQ